MVAKHIAGVALAQELDDFVAEAVLEDGVSGAQELVNFAHAGEGKPKGIDVAVNVRDDAESQKCLLAKTNVVASMINEPLCWLMDRLPHPNPLPEGEGALGSQEAE